MSKHTSRKILFTLTKLFLVYCILFVLLLVFFGVNTTYRLHLNTSFYTAAILLGVSFTVIWGDRGNASQYGFTLGRWHISLLYAMGAIIIFLPLYSVLYIGFFSLKFCGETCKFSSFSESFKWLNSGVWFFFISQLFTVALPEELFFRGYIQTQLGFILSPVWRIMGSAFLFALLHFLISHLWLSWLVFFPGLVFGFLRHKTHSILASVLFHACCNVVAFGLAGVWGLLFR